jgi:glycosyltransferase involved in cell wall biosynthesis
MGRSESPLVSVVMVVLDPDPVYFPQAVQSVLRQTSPDLELIVVEDPSARSAGEFLSRCPDPRVRHVANPRRTSLLEQRNRGLAEARGDFVAVLDADDVWEPDRLEKQLAFLRDHPEVGVVASLIRIIDEAGRVCGARVFPLRHEEIARALRRFNPICQSSVLMRTDLVREAGGYRLKEPTGVEDYELWCRLARRGVRFATYPEALVRYRLHPGQLKATRMRDLLLGTVLVKEMHWRGQADLGDRLRVWLERALLWLPPRLVLGLLARTCYRHTLPESPPPALRGVAP